MEIDKEIILDILSSWEDYDYSSTEIVYYEIDGNKILISLKTPETPHQMYLIRHINLDTYLSKIREKKYRFYY